MVKVSDYVVDFIYRQGVKDVFMLSGGGCMHLIDSAGTHPHLKYYCCLHEQACAMAMEGYARMRNSVGVSIVTSGPGGSNALTGVLGCWLDSTPAVVISGQVKRETIRPSERLRQLGDQEFPIVEAAKSMTKYAALVTDPSDIRYHLEKAFFLAKHGRPGPTWIDIPLDIQAWKVEPGKLRGFDPKEVGPAPLDAKLGEKAEEAIASIRSASRPVMLVGKGIRLAGAQAEFLRLADQLRIPVVTSFSGYDLIPHDHPYYQGRQGTLGPRAGNLIVQNSDLLLCIGTRLNLRMVGYNYRTFARAARKIVVDIDKEELRKPTIKPDVPIQADAKLFIGRMLANLPSGGIPEKREWLDYCRRMNKEYPVVRKEHYQEDGKHANLYAFISELSEAMAEGDALVETDGFACIIPYQAFRVKKGQRAIVNSGCASMGFGLPAAIGAAIASNGGKTVCLEGDGSLQINIQELQTVKHYGLPIKIFVLNNGGYLSIRETQRNYFESRFIASSEEGGVSTPDLARIAGAYGLQFFRINRNGNLREEITQVLESEGPALCELVLDPSRGSDTKAVSYMDKSGQLQSRPLEDLSPLLPREELRKNMFIPLVEETGQ